MRKTTQSYYLEIVQSIMTALHFNNTLCERDMDLLFIESILTDSGFCRLLIDKAEFKADSFQILSAELSKSDKDLGESDITVIIDIEGTKYGFLIEDKIDAIAMPDQHARYVKRGEKGVKEGLYNDFRVFIFCPEKYRKTNKEAKLYEHLLTYEECKDYFDKKNDPLSFFRSRQLDEALNGAKNTSNLPVNEKANAFLRQYIAYQKTHYPSLELFTKEDRNGWWTDFRTEFSTAYINHKIREGFVDLTILQAADKANLAKIVADWARQHKIPIEVVSTKKSVMFRIHVPKLDMLKGFEFVDKDELDQCFDAVKELTDFAGIVKMMQTLCGG